MGSAVKGIAGAILTFTFTHEAKARGTGGYTGSQPSHSLHGLSYRYRRRVFAFARACRSRLRVALGRAPRAQKKTSFTFSIFSNGHGTAL